MSISEEKMMILKMLQEGRINSDEAARLLEALEEKERRSGCGSAWFDGSRATRQPGPNYYDEIAKAREKINEWRREIAKNYNQKDFEKMVDELAAKAEKFGKGLATAAFGIADKIADFMGSIIDTGAYNIFGNCVQVEKTFEAPVSDGSSLELQAANGPIAVKKHQEDRVLIKAKIRTPQDNAENALVFADTDGTVSLKLAKPDTFNLSVSYDVLVPAAKFNRISLITKNGKISVEDITAEEFSGETKNGAIDMAGVTGGKVSVATRNAKVNASYLIGKDVKISAQNSVVDIKNLKALKMDVLTTNGKILLENVQEYEGAGEVSLVLKTANADIKANMNDSGNTGYKVEARTTNGGINLLIPNLLYRDIPRLTGAERHAVAETGNYSTAAVRFNICAETQNGYIEIIK